MNARAGTSLARCLEQRVSGSRLVGLTRGRLSGGGLVDSKVAALGVGVGVGGDSSRASGFVSVSPWQREQLGESEEKRGPKVGGCPSRCGVDSSSSSSSSLAVFRRWLSSSSVVGQRPTPSSSTPRWRTVTISGSGNGTTMTAQCGKHQVTTDQPVKLGGRDLGPDPLSMLLASLLGCEQYVVDVVAKDLSMDIHSVAYEVQADYDPRGFMGDEGVPSHFQKVRIKASVITKESEEKLEELARIVQKRCPVSALFSPAGVDLQVKFVKV